MLTQPELLANGKSRYLKSQRIEKDQQMRSATQWDCVSTQNRKISGSSSTDTLGQALKSNLVTTPLSTFGLNQICAVLKIKRVRLSLC